MFNVKHRYLFIFLLSVYSYLNILFTEGDRLFGYAVNPFLFYSTLLLIVILVWEGNRFLSQLILSPQRNFKIHPLVILFVSSLVVVASIALFVTTLFDLYFNVESHYLLTFKLTLGFSFRINLFLHCLNAIYYFLNQLKDAQLEAETLKKTTAEARFETLRNQVNPHFLFNSFNTLSSLVYKDADASAKFLEQLSLVYRYLLSNQQNKVVRLRNELAFIDSYIYLLKIRFQEYLSIQQRIPERLFETYIAPSTLQLLIENAIKHNIVSKNNPLAIHIYEEKNYLVVQNNIQLKEVKEESTNIGLNNIRSRYDYLCGKDALIVKSNGMFTVKVPIIPADI
jgi:sensor histidine kinase YesM